MGWPIKLPLNTSIRQRPDNIQPTMIPTRLTVLMEGSPTRDLTMCKVVLSLMITLFISCSSIKIQEVSLVFLSALVGKASYFFITGFFDVAELSTAGVIFFLNIFLGALYNPMLFCYLCCRVFLVSNKNKSMY